MKQRLNKDYGSYGQRWQAETALSMLKQRLGSTVNGRSYWSQCRELWLLAISYNIMLLYAVAAFLQGTLVPLRQVVNLLNSTFEMVDFRSIVWIL